MLNCHVSQKYVGGGVMQITNNWHNMRGCTHNHDWHCIPTYIQMLLATWPFCLLPTVPLPPTSHLDLKALGHRLGLVTSNFDNSLKTVNLGMLGKFGSGLYPYKSSVQFRNGSRVILLHIYTKIKPKICITVLFWEIFMNLEQPCWISDGLKIIFVGLTISKLCFILHTLGPTLNTLSYGITRIIKAYNLRLNR